MRIKKKNILFEQRLKHSMPVPKEVKQLYDLFTKAGFALFIVGGAVRDTLLNQSIKDYDLATDATPEQMTKIFDANKIKNVPVEVGGKQAVVNVHMKDDYEIATFREDSKEGDGRRPDSVTFTDIETDVKRRDLTINALFYDIATKEIVDLVGGIADIKNKVIRTVGNADDRFEEDRLRILRAVRFSSRVGSKLDPTIDKSLKNNASLEGISAERIREEFLKGISSAKSVKHFLNLLDRYGLFDWVLRGLPLQSKTFVENPDPIVVLSMILKDLDVNQVAKRLNKLKYTGNEIRQIKFLLSYKNRMSDENFYKLKELHNISKVEDDTFKDFVVYNNLDIVLASRFANFEFTKNLGNIVKDKFKWHEKKDGTKVGAEVNRIETERFLDIR